LSYNTNTIVVVAITSNLCYASLPGSDPVGWHASLPHGVFAGYKSLLQCPRFVGFMLQPIGILAATMQAAAPQVNGAVFFAPWLAATNGKRRPPEAIVDNPWLDQHPQSQ
jgi:hypothetical protein